LVWLGYVLVLGSALVIVLSPWPIAAKLLVLPIVVYAGYLYAARSVGSRTDRTIVAVEPGKAGIRVFLAAEPAMPVQCLVADQFVSRNFITARLEEALGRQKYNLFVTRSMCSDDDFRVLKCYLLSRTLLAAG